MCLATQGKFRLTASRHSSNTHQLWHIVCLGGLFKAERLLLNSIEAVCISQHRQLFDSQSLWCSSYLFGQENDADKDDEGPKKGRVATLEASRRVTSADDLPGDTDVMKEHVKPATDTHFLSGSGYELPIAVQHKKQAGRKPRRISTNQRTHTAVFQVS